ncbi:endocuticle structural glycoprotein SgAbd-4-like [Trichogramma pretiosum]|uniref:endocuticle structural glycoprotein SgAbd-4-like n=1 Tax=Trichogramma pretiosum TaxID=7493 RepID=UPI0006C988D9|nr:endocuticle structural glycoprotein SgAbd-4-like [Trichogramma pretiosum]
MLNAKILLALAICAHSALAAPQLRAIAVGGGGSDADKNAVITSQQLEVNFDGNYVNNFETSNGISHQESGAAKNVGPEGPSIVSQGATSYTAPNGEVVSIQFQADENGYVAQGSHIPTAPPIPPEILRALEWNAAHPEEDSIDSDKPVRPIGGPRG